MYTLVLFVTTTAFVAGPAVDGHPARNLALPPTVSESIVQAGTFPDWRSCDQVAGIVHDRQTTFADIATDAKCLDLTPAAQNAALDR